jgi:hypothetical protein
MFKRGWKRGILAALQQGVSYPWYLADAGAAANCMYAYLAKGVASRAASYDNLAAPGNGLADGTYDLTAGNAPDWNTATGWAMGTATALAGYLKTGYTPTGNATSMLLRWGTLTFSDAGGMWGFRMAAGSRIFVRQDAPDKLTVYNGGSTSYVSINGAAISNQVLGFSNKTVYINGLPVATIAAGTSLAYLQEYIGEYNYDGNPSSSPNYYLLAVARYDVAKNDAQMAAISAAMAAL